IENHFLFAIREDKDSVDIQKANYRIHHCSVEEAIFGTHSQGTEGWTEVFECGKTKTKAIAYYTPILREKESQPGVEIGQVFSELSLSNLNNDINRLKLGKEGYAFLVAKNGTYLTHPNNEYIFNRNLLSLSKN